MDIFNRSVTGQLNTFSKKDVGSKTAGQLFKNPAVFCRQLPLTQTKYLNVVVVVVGVI